LIFAAKPADKMCDHEPDAEGGARAVGERSARADVDHDSMALLDAAPA
jgi:hypothetical protein